MIVGSTPKFCCFGVIPSRFADCLCIAIENCPFIVDLPIKMVIFHSFLNVYQRVHTIKTIMMSIMMVPAPHEFIETMQLPSLITSPLDAIWASSPSSVGYNCVYIYIYVCWQQENNTVMLDNSDNTITPHK